MSTQLETKTPRTDAKAITVEATRCPYTFEIQPDPYAAPWADAVDGDFARQLETELTATQAALKQAVETLQWIAREPDIDLNGARETARSAILVAQPHLPAQREALG